MKKPELEGATRYDGYETAFKQLADVVYEKVFDNMGIMKMIELRDTALDMLKARRKSTTVTDCILAATQQDGNRGHFLKGFIYWPGS